MNDISIIIPHFNNWRKLSELLKTIPNKKGIEVIVIDDHSSNITDELQNTKKNYPNVIFIKNDIGKKGAGAARNKGISIASGKWLLFADSDDKYDLRFLEKVEPYINSNFDIIYFTPGSFYEDTEEESDRHILFENLVRNYHENDSKSNELKLRYYYDPPWSKLIKNDIVKRNNITFQETMVANDVLFSAKVGFYSNKITTNTSTIYYVRENVGSLTSETNEKSFLQRFDVWLNYLHFLNKNLSSEEYRMLEITATPQLLTVIKNKLGLSNLIYVIKTCRKKKIKLVNKNYLNQKIRYNILR